jgi:hypothetical protein
MIQQEPVNTAQNQLAKRFTLTDREGSTQIVFFPQAPGPIRSPRNPQLDYRGPEGQFTFRGDEVNQQQSPLGLLLSVTLQPDLDAGQLDLTLVLPPVNLVGKKIQAFETVAIKSRSRGFVVDRSGAQLTYEVLMLKGSAEGVILPFRSTDESLLDQTQESVLEVTEVKLVVLEIPPQLQITASGTVSSAGWSNPQLVPYTYVQAPPDEIYDFDFVATPPKEAAPQVVTPIRAKYVWKAFPQELKGVRVHASTNSQVALLNVETSPCEESQLPIR